MRSTIFILLTACAVGPVGYFQHGYSGLIVIAIAAATIIASMWLAAWCTSWFTRPDRAAAGLLAGTGIRMLLPLGLVLGVVTIGRGLVEPGSVLYILPLYFVMLVADTVSTVRRLQSPRNETTPASLGHNQSIDD